MVVVACCSEVAAFPDDVILVVEGALEACLVDRVAEVEVGHEALHPYLLVPMKIAA